VYGCNLEELTHYSSNNTHTASTTVKANTSFHLSENKKKNKIKEQLPSVQNSFVQLLCV
jgi:hypothetical protein